METTIVIALITALAAIVSPLITAIINNRSAIRIKELESNQERLKSIDLHEREVLENALSGLGNLMSYADAENFQESCRRVLMAVAYVDNSTADKLIRIVHSIRESKSDLSTEDYSSLCAEIKREIDKRTDR